MPNVPTVFVSSTYYDLRQVRSDLSSFINEELGYRALLSEKRSFPIDPDVDTIENCRRRVQEDADVLVLLIGGRYGFVDSDTKKSVTNLEYLSARQKKIPIYAFVQKDVLALISVWQRSPDADFSGSVDNVAVFDFINQVRSIDKVWTSPFDEAGDIVATLRTQFAYLMREGLRVRLHLQGRTDVDQWKQLSPKAFRIALEHPLAWEYKLFAQVLADEVENCTDLRRQHRLGIALGAGNDVRFEDTFRWYYRTIAEMERNMSALTSLLNEEFVKAVGLPRQPGNTSDLIFVARQLGAVYRHSLEWAQQVRRTHFDPVCQDLSAAFATVLDDAIHQIERLGPSLLQQIDEGLQAATADNPISIQMSIIPQAVGMDRVTAILTRFVEEGHRRGVTFEFE